MVEDTVSQSQENDDDFAAMLAQHETPGDFLQPGQKVSGTIIAVTADNVFVDIGVKLDGIMEKKDLLGLDGKEDFAPGDTIEAWVISSSAQEVRLARSMTGSGLAALENAQEAAVPVEGRVVAVCKGGYSVEVLGKTAFCPGSQIGASTEDAASLVGRTMQFLVTRMENRGRNIVVSRRALLERERTKNLESLLETLKAGDTIEGRITRLTSFGAFLELAPSVEGMVHISELSWSRVGSADEAVSLGDLVRAKVLRIEKNDKGQVRIALSRKQAEGDPWENISERLHAGAVVQGKVTRLAPFGAFVELLPGVEGLTHLSEMSWSKRITAAEEVLAVGDTISVKIKEIDAGSRRISLSLRDAEGDPWQDIAFTVGQTVEGTVEGQSKHGLFVTLAPGITGLLPLGVMKKSGQAGQYAKLGRGDAVTLTIQSVDVALRRIGLAPEGETNLHASDEENAWKQHAQSKASSGDTGIMAQALQKAMQKMEK